MSIDRIGKGAPLPPVAGPEGTGGAEKASAPFSLERGERAERAGAVAETSGVAPLDRLRAGEIDAKQYVELKVDEATKNLNGLAPADLETIRSELRHRMFADPALADLVQSATGTRLTPPEE